MNALERVKGTVTCVKAKTPPPPPTYSFSLVPKLIKVRNGYTDIVLSLLLSPTFKLPGVELKASFIHGKMHFTYSRPFKKFIKSINLTKADFKPFKTYLKSQIKAAQKDPDPLITALNTYLQTGATPSFTIDLGH